MFTLGKWGPGIVFIGKVYSGWWTRGGGTVGWLHYLIVPSPPRIGCKHFLCALKTIFNRMCWQCYNRLRVRIKVKVCTLKAVPRFYLTKTEKRAWSTKYKDVVVVHTHLTYYNGVIKCVCVTQTRSRPPRDSRIQTLHHIQPPIYIPFKTVITHNIIKKRQFVKKGLCRLTPPQSQFKTKIHWWDIKGIDEQTDNVYGVCFPLWPLKI